LLQWDQPDALYRQPAHREVATFIGRGVLVPAAVLGQGGEGLVLVRPGDLRPDPESRLAGIVRQVTFRGPHFEGRVELPGGHLVEGELGTGEPAAVGSRLALAWSDTPAPRFTE